MRWCCKHFWLESWNMREGAELLLSTPPLWPLCIVWQLADYTLVVSVLLFQNAWGKMDASFSASVKALMLVWSWNLLPCKQAPGAILPIQLTIPMPSLSILCHSQSAVLCALPLKGHGALGAPIRLRLVLGRKPEVCRRGPQQHLADAHLPSPACSLACYLDSLTGPKKKNRAP